MSAKFTKQVIQVEVPVMLFLFPWSLLVSDPYLVLKDRSSCCSLAVFYLRFYSTSEIDTCLHLSFVYVP